MTKFTIIRHGETEWNKIGKQQGHLDSPLTENGRNQAEAVAQYLKKDFDVLISSSLGRAIETAEIISKILNLKIIKKDGLKERNLGILQGMTITEFKLNYNEEYIKFISNNPDYIIPNGESINQRYKRAIMTFNNIANEYKNQNILIITHGGILESLFRYTLNIPINIKRAFSLINGSINIFTYDREWKLESWGIIEHLDNIKALDDF